ncbi:MAG: hypothetical protein IPM95_16145 [Sphingobacteriales bacterium]|nr:hypothetical protein [Sphingobacteriales bacterium]
MNKIYLSALLVSFFIKALAATNGTGQTDTSKNITFPAVNCQPAIDSFLARWKSTKEAGFYLVNKNMQQQYNFITIDKDKYTKTSCPKGYPLPSFISCYNKSAKSILDSLFKLNFLQKADSILNNYDKTGRGYKNAEFPGGAAALMKYLNKNVILPKETPLSDTTKLIRVFFSFIVDEKGRISEINKVKSNCKVCEDPVYLAITKFPAFDPAMEAGKKKKVKYILPFTRKL